MLLRKQSGGLILIFVSIVLLTACSKPVGLERPNGVALGADNSLYVMDFGHYRILQVTEEGRVLQSTGKFGPAADQIYFGWDMAVDGEGQLYFGNVVRDDQGTRHDGVKVFSADGKFLREIGAMDYPLHEENEGYLPYGVDVDSQGRVYTADYGANTIRIFSPTGEMLASLSGSGQEGFEFASPGDVVVDDQRSLLYVTDFTLGGLLQFSLLFDVNGKPQISGIRSFGSYGRAPGQFAFPQSLALDEASGTVYVGDMANRRIQAFDPDGHYLRSYTPPSDVQDWQVLGLAAGPDGQVYAGDALNNVVWIFSAEGDARRVEVKE